MWHRIGGVAYVRTMYIFLLGPIHEQRLRHQSKLNEMHCRTTKFPWKRKKCVQYSYSEKLRNNKPATESKKKTYSQKQSIPMRRRNKERGTESETKDREKTSKNGDLLNKI